MAGPDRQAGRPADGGGNRLHQQGGRSQLASPGTAGDLLLLALDVHAERLDSRSWGYLVTALGGHFFVGFR